jgi:CRISPR-associated endonuclease/helicase Cas3
VEDLLLLWGKAERRPGAGHHPLLCHLLDAAAVGEALLPCFAPPLPLPPSWVAYLVALHDIGKADPLFQNKAPGCARLRAAGLPVPEAVVPFRHEARSAEWVLAHLQEKHGWRRSAALLASHAVAGHHGRFRPDDACLDAPAQRRPEWARLRRHLAAALISILAVPPLAPRFPNASRAGVALAGLTILADWIASNEELYCCPPPTAAAEYFDGAREEAGRTVRRLGLEPAAAPPAARTFRHLWPECERLRPVQRVVEAMCQRRPRPGLAIIEAATGDGKTEAAIYLAEHWRRVTGRGGVYFALPSAASSDQMHARYAEFLRRRRTAAEPLLVHGLAWLLDDVSPAAGPESDGDAGEGERAREWFHAPKRALLAPEGVGTVDQAMLAALHVKHGVLRLLGLSTKVLIIDEVHAYDEYMSTILCGLLRWCRAMETPVILLSATLSSRQKRRLAEAYGGPGALPRATEAYPLVTLVPHQGASRAIAVPSERTRRIVLQHHEGLLCDPAGAAQVALAAVEHGGCACVVMNTVVEAQTACRELQRRGSPGTDVLLLHARFRAVRRRELEEAVVRRFGKEGHRPTRAILVATQVVEQSLDVDFDVMLSQLAPVDLLLQRAGRLHRHRRGPRPTGPEAVLHLLLPPSGRFDLGLTGLVYHRLPLLRTLASLRGRSAFDLPQDFRALVEGCYADGPIPMGEVPTALLAAAERERRQTEEAAEAAARLHLIPGPSAREFSLALAAPQPVDEGDEGEAGDYFHACTRLGRPCRRALILHEDDLIDAACREAPPNRETRRRLLLQLVDLPAWWLRDVRQTDGFAAISEGPRWLNGWAVVPMRGGEWRGTEARGQPVTLRDDAALGLVREAATEGGVDAGL